MILNWDDSTTMLGHEEDLQLNGVDDTADNSSFEKCSTDVGNNIDAARK